MAGTMKSAIMLKKCTISTNSVIISFIGFNITFT